MGMTKECRDCIIKALEQQNVLFKSGLLKDCEACRAKIDEAIQYCREVAEEQEKLCEVNDDFNISQPRWRECAEEHRQLAEWLSDYKRLKEQEPILDKIRAEIAIPTNSSTIKDYDEGWEDAVRRDLKIIDKYKAGSEDKE